MSCGQACMYNTLRGCMVDEYGGECPMSNMAYKEQKPMTNADRIRAMTDEELAHWICKRLPSCSVESCPGAELCNGTDGPSNGLVKWLQQPCGGADHA